MDTNLILQHLEYLTYAKETKDNFEQMDKIRKQIQVALCFDDCPAKDEFITNICKILK